MATLDSRLVLHEYKTTFLGWLIPLFFVLGCLIISMSIGLPFLIRPATDIGLWISIGIAFLFGLAMPVGAVAMYLFIPQITTALDSQRRLLVMEYRRPFGRSIKEYPIADIADIVPVHQSENAYSLTMILKSGKNIRLDLSATSNTGELRQQAANIKAQLAPYLPAKSIVV